MIFSTSATTDKGGRGHNEDYYGYFTEEALACWVVADGLGGHMGGEVASRFVTEAVVEKTGGWPEFSDAAITDIMKKINGDLLSAQNEDVSNRGMKTTVVAVFYENGTLKYFHTGDSRFYYFKNGAISARTKDHSLSQMAVDSGEITYEEIRFHEDRNVVLRVIGLENYNPEGLVGTISPAPGDAFLLCTDGFWEYVYENEMEGELALAGSPDEWLASMLARHGARTPKDNDNFTAVCCFVKEGQAALPGGAGFV